MGGTGLSFLQVWQAEFECAAFLGLALHLYGAAMEFDDLFDNGKPQSLAARSPVAGLFGAVEALKDEGQIISRNASTRVLHACDDVRSIGIDGELDLVTSGGVLEGVGKEVAEHLGHAQRIDRDF